jgi:hypothetical protein
MFGILRGGHVQKPANPKRNIPSSDPIITDKSECFQEQ